MSRMVLVVEDDFDTLNPLAELLRLKGYNVITASDAERGLKTAREQFPDLIITDIVLPGKSGLHFITAIRSDEALKLTPIIVISGCGPMILVEAESAGADFCLEKPIRIDNFWAAIDAIFAKSQESEINKVIEPRDEPGPAPAYEIDRLVEELRHCSSKDQREGVLKQLKEQILRLQARNSNCA
ncbi:MAG TPA: response regulator [Blastocatellia bacterium]|nr:response regulator [Blastocatellia bacterium]